MTALASRPANTQLAAPFDDKGIQLSNFMDVLQYSQFLYDAGFAPPGLKSVQAVAIAIICGREVGLSVMQSVQSIAVINSRPTIWGDALPALIQASGKAAEIEEWIEADGKKLTGADMAKPMGKNWVAVCRVVRKGDPIPKFGRFSYEQASVAKLIGKQGPWSNYPARMLQMRARAFCFRDAFADVLGGIGVAEEVQDYEVDRETHLVPLGKQPPQAYWERARLNDVAGAQELIGVGNVVSKVGETWQVCRVADGPAPRQIESTTVQPAETPKPQSRAEAQTKSGADACIEGFAKTFKSSKSDLETIAGKPSGEWTDADIAKLRGVFAEMKKNKQAKIADFFPPKEPEQPQVDPAVTVLRERIGNAVKTRKLVDCKKAADVAGMFHSLDDVARTEDIDLLTDVAEAIEALPEVQQ